MRFAEQFARPVSAELNPSFPRKNNFDELFYLRWGRVRFDVFWGVELNIKVIIKVIRDDNTCEHFIVDTDPYAIEWDKHKRKTRQFFIHPYHLKLGKVTCVKISYIAHYQGESIPSQYDYIFMDGPHFQEERPLRREITNEHTTLNTWRTQELNADLLQRDVDHVNQDFKSINLVPKFTKGQLYHPYHPKRYIHDQIDAMVHKRYAEPDQTHTIKVCVDCIDDTDFINHLLHAHHHGIKVQCIVDWDKMILTNSDNYARLKRSDIELLGVFCTPKDPLIEVSPDMHNKFIIFGDQDCIMGSFNITFDHWWANWESGMTFHSHGMCRLVDNVFQSVRGGVIQRYGIDPLSKFNFLYTFGRHATLNGKYYRPHHAIISEIHRAKHSIKLCLFLIGELQGEHGDSVIDALIHAHHRGVNVQVLLNGHLARQGSPGQEYTMEQELKRPLLPAVWRLKQAGIYVALAYGQHDFHVPYSPIHSKYCIIDDYVVLDGSFNWYNTSVFSHDHMVVVADSEIAQSYLHEFDQIHRIFRIYT